MWDRRGPLWFYIANPLQNTQGGFENMRNLRKLTAVVIAIALVLTSMATAFAATEEPTTAATVAVVNADKAAVLKALNIYAGTNDNDPAAGLEKPLEVQQVLTYLAKAFGYKGTADELSLEDADKVLAKFADGKDVTEYAKRVVAYSVQEGIIAGAKANDGKLFIKPKSAVTAARLATFLVKALGYELKGSWTEAVAQLNEVEGSKIDAAATGDLTRDAAVGFLYGILTAKTSEGKTVAEKLLAADASLQSVLSKNSLLPVNGTLAVDSAKAISNTKVEVKLKEAASATAADFAIVKKGTTTAVAVKEAAKESEKVFIIETEALVKGTAYTLTVNGASVNFTGISADTTAPKIVKATSPDTNTFKIEFTDKMDYATATDVANYTWDKSLKAVKAELNGDRNVVTLTTDAAKRNQTYKLTVANVKNTDGKIIVKDSRTIQAMEDKTAPKIISFKNQNNQMVIIKFQDTNGMKKDTLETVANYSIKDLVITNAKAYENDGKFDTVVLTTETQTRGKSYTLTIENLTDNSVLANPLGKQVRTFPGAPEDKVSPVVEGNTQVKAENNTIVDITFKEANALDAATAEDVSNYVITYNNQTLDVLSAKLDDKGYPGAYDGSSTVTLTTAPQDIKVNYKLEIKGVSDEFGNVIKQVGGKPVWFNFRGSKVDTIPPYVEKVDYVNSNTVKLYFSEKLNSDTAKDPTNYEFNNDVGAPYKAGLSDDKKVVTLTTETLDANKSYTITINGVEDRFENATVNAKAKVTIGASVFDSTIPEISYIDVANEHQINIHFDKKVVDYPKALVISKDGGVTAFANLAYSGILDDGKTIVYKTATKLTSGDYIIRSADTTAFKDEYGNKLVKFAFAQGVALEDCKTFGGNNFQENDIAEVISVEQVNVKKFKVSFSKPVELSSNSTYTFEKGNKDIADTHQTEWYVKKTDNSKFIAGKEYPIDFRVATDLVGANAYNLDGKGVASTKVPAYMEDTTPPVIVNVEAVSNHKIEVTYDEDLSKAGVYKVWLNKEDDEKKDTLVSIKGTPSFDGTVVTITTNDLLSVEQNYYLKVSSPAVDEADNKEDYKNSARWDFAGSDVVVWDYVKGVAKVNATTIKVTATEDIATVVSFYEELDNGNIIDLTPSALYDFDGNTVEIDAIVPWLDSSNYVVEVKLVSGKTQQFSFTGHTPSSGIGVIEEDGLDLVVNVESATDYIAALYTVTGGAISTIFVHTSNDQTGSGDDLNQFTFTGYAVPGRTYYVVLYRKSQFDISSPATWETFALYGIRYEVPTP